MGGAPTPEAEPLSIIALIIHVLVCVVAAKRVLQIVSFQNIR